MEKHHKSRMQQFDVVSQSPTWCNQMFICCKTKFCSSKMWMPCAMVHVYIFLSQNGNFLPDGRRVNGVIHNAGGLVDAVCVVKVCDWEKKNLDYLHLVLFSGDWFLYGLLNHVFCFVHFQRKVADSDPVCFCTSSLYADSLFSLMRPIMVLSLANLMCIAAQLRVSRVNSNKLAGPQHSAWWCWRCCSQSGLSKVSQAQQA